MDHPSRPNLRFLHSKDTLNSAKLAAFRRLSSEAIRTSLETNQPGALKTRPDGTVLDGHHRLEIVLERGEAMDSLAREVINGDRDDA